MKYIYLMLAMLAYSHFMASSAQAQSGYVESRYYADRGSSQTICGPYYTVTVGYDYYGWPITRTVQDCQRQVWRSTYTFGTGYRWSYGYWQAYRDERLWWYYEWQYFTR